jgi:phosphatidylglycerol:prolipoprotein diacylglycerol transferase
VLFYGIFRFFLEFFREPDPQIGFLLGYFTMGQALCFAMILGSLCLWQYIRKSQPRQADRTGGEKF